MAQVGTHDRQDVLNDKEIVRSLEVPLQTEYDKTKGKIWAPYIRNVIILTNELDNIIIIIITHVVQTKGFI